MISEQKSINKIIELENRVKTEMQIKIDEKLR